MPRFNNLGERVAFIAEHHPPLDVENIDLTVRDPQLVRMVAGTAIEYFRRVELEVERNAQLDVPTILPHLSDTEQEFLHVWQAQEIPHGLGWDHVAKQLDLDVAQPNLSQVSTAVRLGGLTARWRGFEEVLRLHYLVMGATNERTTLSGGYVHLQKLFDKLHEPNLSAFTSLIIPQESAHYTYYRLAGLQQRHRMAPWQIHTARRLAEYAWTPVGAGTPAEKRAFGTTALQLLDGETLEGVAAIAQPVQQVANELLEPLQPSGRRQSTQLWLARTILRDTQDGLPVPDFVQKSLQECIDAAQAA